MLLKFEFYFLDMTKFLSLWFLTILIFMEIGFVYGQNAIGFRWVKAPIQGYSFQYPLASKSGRLYSLDYEKISRYDSIGNNSQTFSLPISSTYEPVRFEVTKNHFSSHGPALPIRRGPKHFVRRRRGHRSFILLSI